MRTFKRLNPPKRPEETVILFALSDQNPDPHKFVECDKGELDNSQCSYLWRQGSTEFYGLL